ncbi:MAG: hypothetical protein ACYC61_33495 [Isosphaeraceae bacterium]
MSTIPSVAEVGATMPGRGIAEAHRRLGASQETYLAVVNKTKIPVRLEISGVKNYEWDGNSRPDHNLQGVVLQPGHFTAQREEVNLYANTPSFDITIDSAATGEWITRVRLECSSHSQWVAEETLFNSKFKNEWGKYLYTLQMYTETGTNTDVLIFKPWFMTGDRSGVVRSSHRPSVAAGQAT